MGSMPHNTDTETADLMLKQSTIYTTAKDTIVAAKVVRM